MGFILICLIISGIIVLICDKQYKKLEAEILRELGFPYWGVVSYFDELVIVKSRQTLEKYDDVKFFKENKGKLAIAENGIQRKNDVSRILKTFLAGNEYQKRLRYNSVEKKINDILSNAGAYRICVRYVSSAGNNLGEKEIALNECDINRFKKDPSLMMSKGEYNKYLKEQQKEALDKKHRNYYDTINKLIDYANMIGESLVIKKDKEKLDTLIDRLFEKTVNSIKKIKTVDSEEWNLIKNFTINIRDEIKKIVNRNNQIVEYYNSNEFAKIKQTYGELMNSQREFNEYINEKVNNISSLFGTRVVRNETVNEDEYNYIRTYKKTITPFTAEVSATVFASAENNPIEYVIKYFYSNKAMYPEQIKKLHLLVEELETLREANQIIERYKKEYQQYLVNVPDYIMRDDEAGFYSRLGFANIDESVLTIEYKFSYTSGGGMAQRSFTVPMTEETIIELIKTLENKLTLKDFAKEQRALMTKKLRESIKKRDNYTCCNCGNSTHVEPNLLLEIDHKIPVSKGGYTVEENLQTLCWKCNRAKSNKLVM